MCQKDGKHCSENGIIKSSNTYCTAPSACKITCRSKPHKNIMPHEGKENHTMHFEKLEKTYKKPMRTYM